MKKLLPLVFPAIVVALFLSVIAFTGSWNRPVRRGPWRGHAGRPPGDVPRQRETKAQPATRDFPAKLPPLDEYVGDLVSRLRDPSPEVREHALDVLLCLVPENLEATRAVGKFLQEDKQDAHRSDSLLALAGLCGKHLGPGGKALAPHLGKIFLDGDDSWVFAVRALAGMGPEAHDAVPDLVEALRVLREGGWGRWTNTANPFRETALALGEIGGKEAASAAPLITAIALEGDDALEDSHILIPAARALGALGAEAAAPMVRRLESAIGAEDPAVRLNVLEALVEAGPAARGTLLSIVVALEDGDEEVRRAAARAILRTSCGGHEKTVSSFLLGTVEGGESYLSGDEAKSLREGSIPADAVGDALKALNGEDEDFEYWAAWCLAGAGWLDPGSVMRLGEILSRVGEDDAVRKLLLDALRNLGPGAIPALPPVLELARNGDAKAVEVLEAMGPRALPAMGVLLSLLRSQDPKIRAAAASAASRIGVPAEAVRPLLEALRGTDLHGSFFQPECWWKPADSFREGALPKLGELLAERELREEAQRALSEVGAPALPVLVPALRRFDPAVRKAACELIGWLGVLGREAYPNLLDRLDDPDQGVRDSAREALLRIRGE